MTKQLYYEDSYLTVFEGLVLACVKVEEEYRVVLDQTAFFPEGGGQSADKGVLDGQVVQDVQIQDGIIYHIVENPISIEKVVVGEIDWNTRFLRMQQHSGEHIVSGIVHQMYGYDNVGFHLGADSVTMDFNGEISREKLKEIEYRANVAAVKNLNIDITYPEKIVLDGMEYRSKIEIQGQIRIVIIKGYDICACCAPHVKRTGEIGIIKLTGVQTHRGGVRVSMVCGFRALEDYSTKERNAKTIAMLLSTPEDQIAEAVDRLKEDRLQLKRMIVQLQKESLQYKVAEVCWNEECICMFEDGLTGDAPRELVNLLLQKGTKVGAVFAGKPETGYRYVVGSKSVDLRPLAKELNRKFQGRGGGKPEMVQGTLYGNQEDICKDIKELMV